MVLISKDIPFVKYGPRRAVYHLHSKPTTGIEPVNLILTKDVLYQLSYVGSSGAGNGTRTRNPQLGRLTLWPLSYSRNLKE